MLLNSLGMKPCHAAALALVGWYLMIPPKVIEDSKGRLQVPASLLSQWSILESFDTAKECRAQAGKNQEQLLNAHVSLDEARLLFGKCLATDDPRLKETK
jgi:hypothetical protein